MPSQFIEKLAFRYLPKIAYWLVGLSINRARKSVYGKNIRILIDTNIWGKAVTHEGAWISTGTKTWGDQEVETGHYARIPVHDPNCESEEYRSIQYLAGITRLAKEGHISAFTSAELDAEKDYQPMGRFTGYGYFSYNVLDDLKAESIDGYAPTILGPSYMNLPSSEEQQRLRIANSGDDRFYALAAALDPKDTNDAWHIRTAERYKMYCFLTMDFKLRNKVRDRQRRGPFKGLNTRVMTPEEFGKEFGVMPLPTNIFSYNNASWFVRPDLHWPDNKRRSPKRRE